MEPISGYAPDYAIYRTALARFANRQNWSAWKELHPHARWHQFLRLACLLFHHRRIEMACRPGAAPGPVGFGVRPAQAGARHIKKKCDRRESHPGSLIGNQRVCYQPTTAKAKKNKH